MRRVISVTDNIFFSSGMIDNIAQIVRISKNAVMITFTFDCIKKDSHPERGRDVVLLPKASLRETRGGKPPLAQDD